MNQFTRGPIRDPNPCYGCTRPHKAVGCHDTCKDRQDWIDEIKRVNKNRKAYLEQRELGWRKRK